MGSEAGNHRMRGAVTIARQWRQGMAGWEYRLVVLKPMGDGRVLGSGGMLYNWAVAYTVQSDGAAVNTDANAYIDFLAKSGWELMSTQPVPVVTAINTTPGAIALMFRRTVETP
jgi:hypothetical protein